MTTPAKKAARRSTLEELAAIAKDLAKLDEKRDELAGRRDALLLKALDEDPELSWRNVAAIGKVTHAWIRKLLARTG